MYVLNLLYVMGKGIVSHLGRLVSYRQTSEFATACLYLYKLYINCICINYKLYTVYIVYIIGKGMTSQIGKLVSSQLSIYTCISNINFMYIICIIHMV